MSYKLVNDEDYHIYANGKSILVTILSLVSLLGVARAWFSKALLQSLIGGHLLTDY